MYQNCYPYQQIPGMVPLASMPQVQLPSYTPPQLRGKVVNRIEDVNPNDVSMDGTSSIFPLADESAVFVKRWSSDGTIKTIKYVPEVVTPEKTEITEHGQEILDKLHDINEQLKRLNNSQNYQKKPKREEVEQNANT